MLLSLKMKSLTEYSLCSQYGLTHRATLILINSTNSSQLMFLPWKMCSFLSFHMDQKCCRRDAIPDQLNFWFVLETNPPEKERFNVSRGGPLNTPPIKDVTPDFPNIMT